MCAANLHNIAAALQAYRQDNGRFPPAYRADEHGKPLHSWRTLLLPYLDSAPLFNALDFTEAWDGPKNANVSAAFVSIYSCPSDLASGASGAARTSYVAVVGPNAAWAGEKPRERSGFAGEAGNTIMIVEVVNSGISWAEPRHLTLDSPGASDAELTGWLGVAHRGGRDSRLLLQLLLRSRCSRGYGRWQRACAQD
jgi:hypothetical protein